MAVWLKILSLAALLVHGGCHDPGGRSNTRQAGRDAGPGSCAQLVNAAATSEYPAVWSFAVTDKNGADFRSVCTGTFVSDTTMLTAAHCLPCDGGAVRLLTNGAATTVKEALTTFLDHPGSIGTASAHPRGCSRRGGGTTIAVNDAGKDLGVIVFPPGTSPVYAAVDQTEHAGATDVTFVGYGDPTNGPEAANADGVVKRTGDNALYADLPRVLLSQGIHVASGPYRPEDATDSRAGIAHGDSGGPVMLRSKPQTVIAVNSAVMRTSEQTLIGDIEDTAVYVFASLSSEHARALFAKAKSIGATFSDKPSAPLPVQTGALGRAAGVGPGVTVTAPGAGTAKPVDCGG